MKRFLLCLLVVLASWPVGAQLIPPVQSISSASVGGACTLGTCATWTIPNSNPSVTAQITGTMTSMTVTFEATSDSQTWFAISTTKLSDNSTGSTTTSTGQYTITNLGVVGFRVRCTAYVSGAVNVTLTRGAASAKGSSGGGVIAGVTNHAVMVGTGTAAITSVGPGSTTTVLHGQGASADPSFAAVVEGDFGFTDITTANATSALHGLLPKLSNNPTSLISGKGAWATPSEKRQFKMQSSSPSALAALDCYGLTFSTAGTGSQTNAIDANGRWAVFTTGATSTNAFRWSNNSQATGRLDNLPTFHIRVLTGSTIAAVKYWIGLSDSVVLSTDTPSAGGVHFAGFRFSTTIPDTNWMADVETGSGSAFTAQSTGVAVAINTVYTLKFVVTSTSNIDYYVNDTYVTSITTNIPDVTVSLFPVFFIETTENVAKALSLNNLYMEMN